MDPNALLDPLSAALVLGGTCLATLMRAGWADVSMTLLQIYGITRSGFHAEAQRAELASYVQQMQRDGVIRTDPGAFSDPEMTALADALSHSRDVDVMMQEHQRHQSLRFGLRLRAIATLEIAGELAPLLGLAGTLLALSQTGSGLANAPDTILASVSMAVISTLYGLCLAHLVFAPLAGAISRQGHREDEARQDVVRWLAAQLAGACPSRAGNVRIDDRKVA